MRRVELMSLAQWQQLCAEPKCGPIYQQLRILYSPQILSERLDNLILLKQLCESAIENSAYNGDYLRNPTTTLLQQTQLLIEYILNADDAEHALRLLGEREFYRPYYPHYVTAPPESSAMARALIKCSENRNPLDPKDTATHKRKRFIWRNCTEHLLDLQTGKLRQVNHEQQDNDLINRVGRYSAQDRETHRILPARRHQGFVQLVLHGENDKKQFIIQDFFTRDSVKSKALNHYLFVVTPEGDQFAIKQFGDTDNKHAASSLHFGRAVLFAGLLIAQGQIVSLVADDPHYETEMVNTNAICEYFTKLGILTKAKAKQIRQDNLNAFLARIPFKLHPLERELFGLYGIESTRRSFFNDTPAIQIIWERAQEKDISHAELKDRTLEFISAQEKRFQDALPPDLLKLRINEKHHLKALLRIENDPFIANKHNAMDAYEERIVAQLTNWACQKASEELQALKRILLSILSELVTQKSLQRLVENLTHSLQEIAKIAMEIDAPKTQEQNQKQMQLTKFIAVRNQLFEDLRSQPRLKQEHQSLLQRKLL